jgi:hypothetical protein
MLNFNLLDMEQLPDDYFEDVIENLANREKHMLFLNSESVLLNSEETVALPVLSPLAFVDVAGGTIYMGQKYPSEPSYDVINDPRPAQEVFSWMEDFCEGVVKEFPNVTVGNPIIPHSRYMKAVELDKIDDIMIAKGFRLLEPTMGQKLRYPTLSDDKMRKSIWVTRGSMTLDEFAAELRQVKSMEGFLYFNVVEDCVEIVCENELLYLAILKRSVDLAFRWTFVSKGLGWLRRHTSIRYFCRTYRHDYNSDQNFICGFDINPFSPYGVPSLLSVEFDDMGVSYSKKWKDSVIYGKFWYRDKRYHSDVWFPDFFSREKPYNRALMSLDIVTNSYSTIEQYMFNRHVSMSLMMQPLFIDPFRVSSRYMRKVFTNRAPIRYRVFSALSKSDVMAGGVFLPYVTMKSVVNRKPFDEAEIGIPVSVKRVDKIVIDQKEILPEAFFDKINLWLRNSNVFVKDRGFWQRLLQLSMDYFVQQEYSKRPGKGIKYSIYKKCDDIDVGAIKVDYVPYAIYRYPHNKWGSLVADMMVITLEQFAARYGDFRSRWKVPPWLFEVGGEDLSDLELETDDTCDIDISVSGILSDGSLDIYAV